MNPAFVVFWHTITGYHGYSQAISHTNIVIVKYWNHWGRTESLGFSWSTTFFFLTQFTVCVRYVQYCIIYQYAFRLLVLEARLRQKNTIDCMGGDGKVVRDTFQNRLLRMNVSNSIYKFN